MADHYLDAHRFTIFLHPLFISPMSIVIALTNTKKKPIMKKYPGIYDVFRNGREKSERRAGENS